METYTVDKAVTMKEVDSNRSIAKTWENIQISLILWGKMPILQLERLPQQSLLILSCGLRGPAFAEENGNLEYQ